MTYTFSRVLNVFLLASLAGISLLWWRERQENVALRQPWVEAPSDEAASEPLQSPAMSTPVIAVPAGPASFSETRPSATIPASPPPPATPPDNSAGLLNQFDYAMDHEFERLERREGQARDGGETTTLQSLKEQLLALDELYRRAEEAATPEERAAVRDELQAAMVSVIALSRADRNERLGKLATDIGYTDPQAIETFIREVDHIYHDTHMDWTKLFNRTPPE